MNANELRPGKKVRVTFPDLSPRDDRDAVVVKVPPFTENIAGEKREVTDAALVQFPGTSLGREGFDDIAERIPLERIEEVED